MFKNPRNKEEAIGCATFVLLVISALLFCTTTNILTLLLVPASLVIHTISMHFYEKTLKVTK